MTPPPRPAPDVEIETDTSRYGTARITAGHRLHPRLTRRGPWRDHPGQLPIIDGTLIRLTVDRLPGDREPKPVWLWHSRPTAAASDVDRLWRMFLRRFDIEHTFRFLKQTLGWTGPRLRAPDQGDRWTWLIIAAHTQLRLARGLAEDLRRPWEKPVTETRKLACLPLSGLWTKPLTTRPWPTTGDKKEAPSPTTRRRQARYHTTQASRNGLKIKLNSSLVAAEPGAVPR